MCHLLKSVLAVFLLVGLPLSIFCAVHHHMEVGLMEMLL